MLAFLLGAGNTVAKRAGHQICSGKLRVHFYQRITRVILFADHRMPPSLFIQQRVAAIKSRVPARVSGTDCFAVEFVHQRYYLAGQGSTKLIALIYVQVDPSGVVSIEGSIQPFSLVVQGEVQNLSTGYASLRHYCKHKGLAWMHFTAPWLLAPVKIPKPWGRELWFTGIEARGQSEVCGEGGNLPLPWILSLFPQTKNPNDEIILLKILDPLPDEVYGDLYLELHEQKQEVYVVAHLDEKAWPNKVASMRLGFNQEMRQSYANDETFRQSYLKVVQRYESVRRELDSILIQKKKAAALALDQPVAAEILKKWMNELSQATETTELAKLEKKLRSVMDSFIGAHPLRVGDWVKIPRNMPHSLQHGIRVIEFQTPVYERKILSFAQQVLTQSHWDTEIAMQLAELEPYQPDVPVLLSSSESNRIERIARFDDFDVRRIHLEGHMNLDGDTYSLLMTLQGEISVQSREAPIRIANGQAVLLPVTDEPWKITTSATSILLHSLPASKGSK